jgi:hypothetical protein
VIPIDNTLIDRDGLLIPDAGGYGDPAEQRPKIAQDSLFRTDVCTRGPHSPREGRLFRKQALGQTLGEPFRNPTALGGEVSDRVGERDLPGDFARDGSFTSAEVLNPIHGQAERFGRPRGYVGDLKTNGKLAWKGQVITARVRAASIPAGDRQEMRIGKRRPWSFAVTGRLPGLEPTVRIVIRWPYRKDPRCGQSLVTNRTPWAVSRIVRVDRPRGTGTESFPRDGPQPVGLGDCQLRDLQGQTRPMDLVLRASSLLRGQWRQGRAKQGALPRLMTLGEACRARVREAVRTTLAWALEQVTERNQPSGQVVAQLGLT